MKAQSMHFSKLYTRLCYGLSVNKTMHLHFLQYSKHITLEKTKCNNLKFLAVWTILFNWCEVWQCCHVYQSVCYGSQVSLKWCITCCQKFHFHVYKYYLPYEESERSSPLKWRRLYCQMTAPDPTVPHHCHQSGYCSGSPDINSPANTQQHFKTPNESHTFISFDFTAWLLF